MMLICLRISTLTPRSIAYMVRVAQLGFLEVQLLDSMAKPKLGVPQLGRMSIDVIANDKQGSMTKNRCLNNLLIEQHRIE